MHLVNVYSEYCFCNLQDTIVTLSSGSIEPVWYQLFAHAHVYSIQESLFLSTFFFVQFFRTICYCSTYAQQDCLFVFRLVLLFGAQIIFSSIYRECIYGEY